MATKIVCRVCGATEDYKYRAVDTQVLVRQISPSPGGGTQVVVTRAAPVNGASLDPQHVQQLVAQGLLEAV